jgi:hypothetical protein
MQNSFKPDARVAEIALAYAEDAVDIAARNFGICLDWSESSIRLVERMLEELHNQMPEAQPDEETILTFAKMFGSYIGEVLRRHHGGEWGIITFAGQQAPGLQYGRGSWCWPWDKAYKRLVNGPEDNVWHYYLALVYI